MRPCLKKNPNRLCCYVEHDESLANHSFQDKVVSCNSSVTLLAIWPGKEHQVSHIYSGDVDMKRLLYVATLTLLSLTPLVHAEVIGTPDNPCINDSCDGAQYQL